MGFETPNKLDEILNLDQAFEEKAFSLLHQTDIKNETDNVWEKIIIANELKLLGSDIEAELSSAEKQNMSKELSNLRENLKNSNNPIDYIDLARCLYRFKNLNIPYEKLNNKERDGILKLPELFRSDKDLRGHLAYLPQIAASLDVNIDDIKKESDGLLVRQEIENKILDQDQKEKFNSMALSGLLLDLDSDEFKKMVNSESWSKDSWNDTVKYLTGLKNSPEKNDWYVFLRLANSANKVIRFLNKK